MKAGARKERQEEEGERKGPTLVLFSERLQGIGYYVGLKVNASFHLISMKTSFSPIISLIPQMRKKNYLVLLLQLLPGNQDLGPRQHASSHTGTSERRSPGPVSLLPHLDLGGSSS
jgi:hypothetical protein